MSWAAKKNLADRETLGILMRTRDHFVLGLKKRDYSVIIPFSRWFYGLSSLAAYITYGCDRKVKFVRFVCGSISSILQCLLLGSSLALCFYLVSYKIYEIEISSRSVSPVICPL